MCCLPFAGRAGHEPEALGADFAAGFDDNEVEPEPPPEPGDPDPDEEPPDELDDPEPDDPEPESEELELDEPEAPASAVFFAFVPFSPARESVR